jgi:hypothetical protein
VPELKEEVRGFLEQIFDDFLVDLDVAIEDISWIEEQMPLTSKRDLVVGFSVGSMGALAFTLTEVSKRKKLSEAEEKEEEAEIWMMIKRRLPEILESVERELNK